MNTVKVALANETSKLPTKSTNGSAGYDLYSNDDNIIIEPNDTKPIHTGIRLQLLENYVGLVYARSGLGCRYGLVPSNCVGVIDSDYRGEIIVYLHNHGKITCTINRGDRIAQLIISELPRVQLELVNELDDTNRSSGGFGSTGK